MEAIVQEEVLDFNFSQRAFAALYHGLPGANSYSMPETSTGKEEHVPGPQLWWS